MVWDHHRSGWRYAMSGVRLLHDDNGILFNGYLDGVFGAGWTINEPFVGFFHNAPKHPEGVADKYEKVKSLEIMLSEYAWAKSVGHCRGLFVLSDYLADFLRVQTGLHISVVRHPTAFVKEKFQFQDFINNSNKKLLCIGHWMRNFKMFFDIAGEGYQKHLLMGGAEYEDHNSVQDLMRFHSNVIKHDYVLATEYDHLLTENVACVPLYDASANNVVIECMVRNTPILINRLPAAVEYLGEEYPFFFDNVDEAVAKLRDIDLIEETAIYLTKMDKAFLSLERFVTSIMQSSIYVELESVNPLPML